MEENDPHKIRWSTFKVLFTMLLVGVSIGGIYLAIMPVIEGDYSKKNLANLPFAAILFFYMFSFWRLERNYEWVFWACNFGLIVFCSIMFIEYETLFE